MKSCLETGCLISLQSFTMDFIFMIIQIKNIRNSGVLKKMYGEWKIIQIHFSSGKKGQEVKYKIAN